ncbi:MAG: hypothetical protein G01um101416_451 [Microgenomates group bacterium Gr01-1014_16]|nr:MAG: hypothetical protein G01um101416_451 [Microgenomates group bacterium Gr01-1014_16]
MEILIAFAVAVIAIVGLAQIATKSVANAGAAKRSAQATVYAMEGLEWITGERDTTDWQTFYARSGAYCISGLTWASLPCGTIGTTEYSRSVVVTPAIVNSVQQVTAAVTVTWTEGTRTASVSQTSKFSPY